MNFLLWRQRFGYALTDFSCNLVWQMISMYLMFFYTDVVGLPAYSVGLMFLVARIIDGITDILMGLVIDNTNTRWGRCRPYLLIGAIPFGLMCVLTFYVPEFGVTGKLIYAFITYSCLSLVYTAVNVPYCVMLPFLTDSSKERTMLSTIRMLFGALGSTVVAVGTLPLVKLLGVENQAHGFLTTAILFGVISAIFLLISFKTVEEKIKSIPVKMTLNKSWEGLKSNQPWIIFATNIFFMWGAFFFQTGALVYFFNYCVGNTGLTAIIAGISTFVPLIGTLSVPLLASRMKKRQVYLIASTINVIGMIVMIVAGVNTLVLIIGAVILSIGAGQRVTIYFSMQADPVDYGIWKTGINTAGVLTAINGFIGKVTMAIAGAITGVLLSAGGYVANQTQTESTLLIIKACYLYIPLLLIIISMILIGKFYRLDDNFEQIRKEIDAR